MTVILALALASERSMTVLDRWHVLDPLNLGIATIGIAIPALFTAFVFSLSRNGNREGRNSVGDRRTYLVEARLRHAAAMIRESGRR